MRITIKHRKCQMARSIYFELRNRRLHNVFKQLIILAKYVMILVEIC